MKKYFLIACTCTALALASCGSDHKQGTTDSADVDTVNGGVGTGNDTVTNGGAGTDTIFNSSPGTDTAKSSGKSN